MQQKKVHIVIILFGAFSPENNVSDNFPKILPVGAERMRQICLQITTLALLDFLQGLRHVDIERRQEAWLRFYPKFLYLFFVQIEILLTQRAHTYQFHLTLQDVDEHGQLVEPGLTQELSPLGDAIVVIELATHIQVVVLIDIGLQVLRIGIHGAELEHIELLPVLPYPA